MHVQLRAVGRSPRFQPDSHLLCNIGAVLWRKLCGGGRRVGAGMMRGVAGAVGASMRDAASRTHS